MALRKRHQYYFFVPEHSGPESARFEPASLVADQDLQTYVSNNSGATVEAIQAHEGLRTYAQRISDHEYSRLFIPAHVGGNHWIVFSVDFEKQTFEYGEFV